MKVWNEWNKYPTIGSFGKSRESLEIQTVILTGKFLFFLKYKYKV